MFESLTDKLQGVFKKLRGKGGLTETDVNEALREVRLVLLEADVNFKVVKDFVATVKERALGQDILKGLNPAQQVIKIVNEEMVKLLGGEQAKLKIADRPPTVIMVAGLHGAGKTTQVAKLANMFKKQGRKPLLVAGDVYRPAAILQLKTLGEQVGGDAGVLLEQVAVATRPHQEISQEQQRPPLAHEIERAGDAAELVVRALGHGRSADRG
jgi:signal recognition particle subunit SRP54